MDETKFAAGKVVTGLSSPYVALYNNTGGTVTYTEGMVLARGVDFDPQIETTGDDNVFYTNNRACESAPQRFRRGTLNIEVDGLLRKAESLIMGLAAKDTVTVGETPVTVYDYGDGQVIPYVGVGAVVRSMSNGIELFQAVMYTKARFAQFTVKAHTEEDSIDWQTQSLSAVLQRDDTPKHNWQRVSEPCATELEAENVLRVMLGMEPLSYSAAQEVAAKIDAAQAAGNNEVKA